MKTNHIIILAALTLFSVPTFAQSIDNPECLGSSCGKPKEEGGGYAITFPDLAGCRSDGATPEKAMENGRLALADWLAVATEFGDPVPVPYSSLSGRFVQRVPKSLHRQLVDEAKNEGVSLNTLVVSLVAEGLGRRVVRPSIASRSSGGGTKRRTA